MKRRSVISIMTATAILVAGCREQASAPPGPVTMTAEALGHYCQMNLTEHPGPKAQVHLEGISAPLFFSQVRDAIAYQRLPEQSHPIRAIYVSDMARAKSWEAPGIDNWVAVERAVFVVDSKKVGGMGVPELVPFSDKDAAAAFVAEHGGSIRELREIPDEAVLRPLDVKTDADGNFVPPAVSNSNE